MILIEEIINLLTTEDLSLRAALQKTKVLLHRLGEKDLVEWVNGELQGYGEKDNLPSYRITSVHVRGDISDGVWRYSNESIPIGHLEDDIREFLTTSHLTQSIAVIEEYMGNENLQIRISPEFYSLLSQAFTNGYRIERAWGVHSAGTMTQIVTEVASRLLDFVLELSDRIPEELNSIELKAKSKEVGVSDLFNHTVFGNNTTIVVGDSNTQNVRNSISNNDFNSLKDFLVKNKVSEEDISDLESAIESDKDSEEMKAGKFGANVRAWIGKMVSKAGSTAWNINIGIAGSLLANALTKYYGF